MDLNGLLDDRREGRCKRIVGLEREDARFSPGVMEGQIQNPPAEPKSAPSTATLFRDLAP